MLAVERRNQILEKLQKEKRVVVSELSHIYEVSEETIRRDLDKLHRDGLVVKSYGGAILNENTNIDMPFNVRKKHNIAGKQVIAELVAEQIVDGEDIILDASTTAVFTAKALKKRSSLNVLTNSIEIMVELSDMPEWTIFSTGGVLKETHLAMVGAKVIDSLREYNVGTAVLSCKGLDLERGVTDGDEQFADVKKAMLKTARRCILAVDYSKFDRAAFSKICDIRDIDMVVTDKKPVEHWLAFFERQGVECIHGE